MNAIAIKTQTSSEFDELKTRLKTTWMTGNYDLFSRFMEKDAEQFFPRLGVNPELVCSTLTGGPDNLR